MQSSEIIDKESPDLAPFLNIRVVVVSTHRACHLRQQGALVLNKYAVTVVSTITLNSAPYIVQLKRVFSYLRVFDVLPFSSANSSSDCIILYIPS